MNGNWPHIGNLLSSKFQKKCKYKSDEEELIENDFIAVRYPLAAHQFRKNQEIVLLENLDVHVLLLLAKCIYKLLIDQLTC